MNNLPDTPEDQRIYVPELRQLGFQLPEGVPNCAWVPRSALRVTLADGTEVDADRNRITLHMTVEVVQPLNWIELHLVV